MKILYTGNSKEEALSVLSRNPEWALHPIQIKQIEYTWVVIEVKASKLYDETLFVTCCTFNEYLLNPDKDGFDPHWLKLDHLEEYGFSIASFAADVAQDFDSRFGYMDLQGHEFNDKLDGFITYRLMIL